MKIATTTSDFAIFLKNDIDRIRELNLAGFKYVDLSMYSFTPNSVYMGSDWKNAVATLKDEAQKLGITFVQAHSQGGNPLNDDPEHVNFLIDATIRSIQICHELGIKNTVVHPGYSKNITKEQWFEKNRSFYKKLIPTMENCGVNVLIENSTSSNMKDKYFANSGKDMLEFIRFINHPHIHACWDTGHANCEGSQYDDILTLGKELYAIHYNDNHGLKDEHLLPYLGTLNHDEIINALIDIDYNGYFTLESTSSLIPQKYWLGGRRDFKNDNRLCDPPIFIQQDLEKLLYKTAKYLLQSYNLFEE